MKVKSALILGLGLALSLSAAEESPLFKTPKGKMSYGLGMDIGRNITNQQVEVDPDALAAGIKAVLTGAKSLLTEQEAQEAISAFRTEMANKRAERARQMEEKRKESAAKAKQDSEAFLAENKKKPDVVTLPSGLQYKIVKAGTGPKPSSNDTVVTHYRGTFIDGTEFDNSYRRGETVSFPVRNVIKGWQEALQLMPVDSKWQLFIPSELGYGERGSERGPRIPPNSALLFDIELVGIQAPTNKVEQAKPPTGANK
jgi:FKBP-type peptidyl-prolyl cis-trans isomerase FklB